MLVRKMLEYLYTLDYSIDEINNLVPETTASVGRSPEDLAGDELNEAISNASDLAPPSSLKDIPPTCNYDPFSFQDLAGDKPNEAISNASDLAPPSSLKDIPPTCTYDPLSFHILMYSLADRLFIRGLKSLAKENFEKELRPRLVSKSFPVAVIEVYSSTPEQDRGLRDLVVKITVDNLTKLREKKGSDHAILQNRLLKQIPEFAYDLSVAMMDKCVSGWEKHDAAIRTGYGWPSR